ncbi:MAG: 2-phospho-L-lactate guanylyltransferase [Spongiibacteraceae bacterium]
MQVLLPLKEFAAAKQRLAGVLSAAERAQLFEAMVEDVLRVLTQHPDIKNIAICSRDNAAKWLASYYGVEFIDESKLSAHGLNEAVNKAAHEIQARDENDLLVVHGDLPMLSAADVTQFLQVHRKTPHSAVTMVADRHSTGTNLLAWRALSDFSVAYGEHSFQRHCAQARALNIEPAICDLSSVRCDIDELEDLWFLLSRPLSTEAVKTLKMLHESGIAKRLLAMQCEANISCDGGERERA